MSLAILEFDHVAGPSNGESLHKPLQQSHSYYVNIFHGTRSIGSREELEKSVLILDGMPSHKVDES